MTTAFRATIGIALLVVDIMRITSELTVVPRATCEVRLKHTCTDEQASMRPSHQCERGPHQCDRHIKVCLARIKMAFSEQCEDIHINVGHVLFLSDRTAPTAPPTSHHTRHKPQIRTSMIIEQKVEPWVRLECAGRYSGKTWKGGGCICM